MEPEIKRYTLVVVVEFRAYTYSAFHNNRINALCTYQCAYNNRLSALYKNRLNALNMNAAQVIKSIIFL